MVAVAGKGWKLAPSLVELVKQLDSAWPERDRSSDGSIGDAEHASRESDHNPYQGWVHAVDLDENVAPGADLKQAAESLRLSQDPRLQYVIYEGRVFKSYAKGSVPAWTWTGYTGPNAHGTHMHVSIVRSAAARDDLRLWPLEGDDMTPEQDQLLRQAAFDAKAARQQTDRIYSGELVTLIAEAVVKILPKANGGQGASAKQVADEIAARLKD